MRLPGVVFVFCSTRLLNVNRPVTPAIYTPYLALPVLGLGGARPPNAFHALLSLKIVITDDFDHTTVVSACIIWTDNATAVEPIEMPLRPKNHCIGLGPGSPRKEALLRGTDWDMPRGRYTQSDSQGGSTRRCGLLARHHYCSQLVLFASLLLRFHVLDKAVCK